MEEQNTNNNNFDSCITNLQTMSIYQIVDFLYNKYRSFNWNSKYFYLLTR